MTVFDGELLICAHGHMQCMTWEKITVNPTSVLPPTQKYSNLYYCKSVVYHPSSYAQGLKQSRNENYVRKNALSRVYGIKNTNRIMGTVACGSANKRISGEGT